MGKYAYPHLCFFLQLSFSLLSWGADYFSFFWEGREIITVDFKGSENSLDIYNSYPFKNSFYVCLGWFKPYHIRFPWQHFPSLYRLQQTRLYQNLGQDAHWSTMQTLKPSLSPRWRKYIPWWSFLSFVTHLFVLSEVAALTDSWVVAEIGFIFLLLRKQSTCLWKLSSIVRPTMALAASSVSSSGIQKASVSSNSKRPEGSRGSAPEVPDESTPVSFFLHKEVYKMALSHWKLSRAAE